MRFRSLLFTPGDRTDRVRKAWETHAADVVVADLEDAVAPVGKDDARAAVAALLAEVPRALAVRAVRINPWPLAPVDLDAVLPGKPDLVVVPKVETAQQVEDLARRMDEAGSQARLLLILETAKGVLHAEAIAHASPRTVAIAFGAEDLAADAGMRRSASNAEVAVPRGLVALAAAAARVAAVDMITVDYKDLDRTRREAVEARGLGFSGKMCIHPAQVDVVHEAFAPTADERAWAQRVVEATDAAGAGQGGIVVVDGKMVDVPVIEQARRILRDAA